MKGLFASLAVLIGMSSPLAAVELLVEDDRLDPTTTLELRFPTAMVGQEELGLTLAESPLLIEPALPGGFTWLSTRSGVFTPSQVPRLGTDYLLTLRPGLADQAGNPVEAGIDRVLSTPPFAATVIDARVSDDKEVAADVAVRIAFNLKVDPASEFRFVSDQGGGIDAKVRHAKRDDWFRIADEDGDWEARWNPLVEEEGKAAEAMEEQRDRLVIQPVTPLAPGAEWRLEAADGVRSLDGGQATGVLRIPLGTVRPFVVEKVDPMSLFMSGRSISLGFSDSFAPDVDERTAAEFVRVQPEVPGLEYEAYWKSIVIRGGFERGTGYTVTIDPSLLSRSLLPVSGELTHRASFDAVKPRLYLPEFTGHQLSEGSRRFEVRSANLKSLRVKALRVDRDAMSAAVEAFKDYEKPWSEREDPDESYQALPEGAVKGELIFDREVAIDEQEIDAVQSTMLDWDEILGGRRVGGILLTVEGEPLLEGATKRPAAQALMQLTDLGVLWKHVDGAIRVNVFSMASGEAVNDVEVRVLNKAFGELSAMPTDRAGAAVLPDGEDIEWMEVRLGDDVHAFRMGPRARGLPMHAFGLPVSYAGWTDADQQRQAEQRKLVFTDRPLYLPGETVRVKGMVRRVEDGALVAGRESGKLVLRSSGYSVLAELEVTTDERGSFDASMELDSSTVGACTLEFDPDHGSSAWTNFVVAEFQPNAFEVGLAVPPHFAPGETPSAEVSANYFFGAPIEGARVRWTWQSRPRSPRFDGYPGFSFDANPDEERDALTLRGETTLDGSAAITPRLPAAAGVPCSDMLTVEVTDLNQQTVSATRSFQRDSSDLYLGVSLGDHQAVNAGEPFPLVALAVDPAGEPLAQPREVTVRLVRLEQRTVRVLGAGGAIAFENSTTEETVAEVGGETVVPVREDGKWRFDHGETARLVAPEAGQYRVLVEAVDGAGRQVVAARDIHAWGGDVTSWSYRHPSQVDLVPDRERYRVGDTAKVLVKTPIVGEALVSIERGTEVLRQFHARLEGNAPVVEVPIEEGDLPNVLVSVVLVRGARDSTRAHPMPEFRYGACLLEVENPRAELAVAIEPAKPAYEPGETVEVAIDVRGADGAPVPGAELTFFAVDDGILALTGYERPDPLAEFGRPLGLAVETGITLFELLPEDPDDLEFGNKGYLIGGGGGAGPGPMVRNDFPGTAVWLPSLRTDANGRAVASFKAPDALTRYRLVAVANADADRFGSAESAIAIRKPLVLLSALGQQARLGDELIVRAVLRNETGTSGAARVELELDGTAEPLDGLVREFDLAVGEARTIDLPVRLVGLGGAKWTWSARLRGDGREFDDALGVTLGVGSPAPLLREVYLADLEASETDLLAGVNPQLLEGEGRVAVTLSNTRLASLRAPAEELMTYPYGCLEQRASALVPWFALAELGPVLAGDIDANARESTIRQSIEEIFALQTDSGGLGYWTSRSPAGLHTNAWAALVLARAGRAGAELPDGWPGLLEYLSGSLRGLGDRRSRRSLDDQALAVYALASAGRPEPAYHDVLYDKRDELSHESRALLALAMMLDGSASRKPVEGLLDIGIRAPEGHCWFGSPTRALAVRLLAWTQFRPKDKEVGVLVAELLRSRRSGSWRTTQENAWSLVALSEYFRVVEGEVRPVTAELWADSRSTRIELNEKRLTGSWSTRFTGERTPWPITVENPRHGRLFAETRFEVLPAVADQPRQDRGFAVARRYCKLGDDGSLEDVDELEVGDRVIVTLEVATGRPAHFVAVDDPLPAILEAVNPEFRTQRVGGAPGGMQPWRADHRETRADRVVYFCDHLPAGSHRFQYLARVRAAGKVVAPGTKVEEMYRPERFGLGSSERLESHSATR